MKNSNESNLLLIIKSIAIGLACSVATCIIALLLLGYMLLSLDISDSVLSGIIGVVCAGAAFVGGFITSRLAGRAGLIMGAVNTVLCFAVMCIICLIFSDQAIGAMGFVRLGIMLLFGMTGGALGVRRIKSTAVRHR